MVSFSILALLASAAAAVPFALEPAAHGSLEARQAQMPGECTQYCSVSAGCVCIKRPTNCVANYTVASGDNCGTIVDKYNTFTAHDLYLWNPEIGRQCFGLQAYVPVCINVSGYKYPGAVKGGDFATPDQIPVPIQPGIVSNCTKFEYTDKTGNPGLAKILSSNKITKQQWNGWNFPSQDRNGDWAVWAQFWSCVAAPK
ncbi:hypothetical protein EJ04DRAFT_481131 [Polyplosphaeria fusca]|uniref:LysM domain-containing protein n=1 Tax=Polyplosphaeria fusca TaxID=682080 RepID=A0A9P4R8G0_9PLEO|nr:hypothetical protein EJ04DRAFT_481131 [Polyplosphaeria fusca]